jgi:hypothetical protein
LIARSQEAKGSDYGWHLYKKPYFSQTFFNGGRPNNKYKEAPLYGKTIVK